MSCPPSPPEVVPIETEPLLSGALAAFTARLDGLCTDQSPEELSNALRAAFKERELYNFYAFSLVRDIERAKVLLEVFDKVRPAETTIP